QTGWEPSVGLIFFGPSPSANPVGVEEEALIRHPHVGHAGKIPGGRLCILRELVGAGDTKLITRIFTDERVEAWRKRYFWVNAATAILALASFLLFHGAAFPAGWERWVALFQSMCLVVLIGETAGVYVLS